MRWYEVDKKRVIVEAQKIRNKYPEFKIKMHDNLLSWEGSIALNVGGTKCLPIKVKIVCEDSYPIIAPSVFPVDNALPDELVGHKWHRYTAGQICYVKPSLWDPHYYIIDIIEKLQIWYEKFVLYHMQINSDFEIDSGSLQDVLGR